MDPNFYLARFQTTPSQATPTEIKVYFRIDCFDIHSLSNCLTTFPDATHPASGDINLAYELISSGSLPASSNVIEKWETVYVSKDWHLLPQPHTIRLTIYHDKGDGRDDDSMPTSDPIR